MAWFRARVGVRVRVSSARRVLGAVAREKLDEDPAYEDAHERELRRDRELVELVVPVRILGLGSGLGLRQGQGLG